MKSLYAQYIEEREKKHVYETERGFIKYSYEGDDSKKICYIEDIFVLKEFRQTREASKMADHVSMVAKDLACFMLYGSVDESDDNADSNIKVLQGYEMKFSHTVNGLMYFKKEL